jgi:23S rRNA (cytosine1962-C5)-methyltransferase
MTSSLPTLAVSKRAAERIRGGHLWVYRSDLAKTSSVDPPTAALVLVTDERGKPLGSALSSSSSQIALRMVSSLPLAGDDELLALLRTRTREALQYRKLVVPSDSSNACRLIFSEADGLPGIIADRYNDVIALQFLTQAADRADIRQLVVEELQTGTASFDGARSLTFVERVDPRIRQLESLPASESKVIAGEKPSTIYSINGLKFHYDALTGQKTGAFLDQRENYAAAEAYARGHALDVFCYEGGFALHLARRCETVTAVDSSRPALEAGEKNARLNKKQFRPPEIEWIEANAFDLLKDYAASKKLYDTVVLDPPAFAKAKRNLDTAMRGYKELNLRALKMLRPGGILVSCSCSFHVGEADFLEMLTSAASDAHRQITIVEKRGQAKDHPILLGMPETAYLKCFELRVSH